MHVNIRNEAVEQIMVRQLQMGRTVLKLMSHYSIQRMGNELVIRVEVGDKK